MLCFLCLLQFMLPHPLQTWDPEPMHPKYYIPGPLHTVLSRGHAGSTAISARLTESGEVATVREDFTLKRAPRVGLCLSLRGSGRGDDEDSDASFAAASGFEGPRPGFVFKMGASGLGYYKDLGQVSATVSQTLHKLSRAHVVYATAREEGRRRL